MKKNLLGISLLTVTCLYGVLAAIVILVCLVCEIDVIFGIILSILILVIQFLVAPWLTDLSMRLFYKADFNHEIPDYLRTFITEVCNKYGMKYPKIGFIDDGAPNAFTYGRTKNDARVVITRGILELLNEEEVKAVVAHELGHAIHYDMLFMTVVQLVPLILYGIYEMLSSVKVDSDDDNKAAQVKIVIQVVAYVLYIISQYIILWLSRTREYYADSFAVEETRNPASLAEALVKIGYGLSTSSGQSKGLSAAKSNALGIFDSKTSKSLVVSSYDSNNGVSKENIVGAMKWEMWNVWAKWYELSSTHPLISKRLIAISNRCQEFNQEPYIVFDAIKPESYVDDFFRELLINFLPTIAIILGILIAIITDNGYIGVGLGGILLVGALFINLNKTHKNTGYKETNVNELLGEVKVSGITSIPCILKGKIIGRGNPGCIFNEDFVIQDETGIIFLDYNQPINLANKIFALFKSKEYFDKEVIVKGWYRRFPVPYVEIYDMEIDGQVKKCHTYGVTKVCYIILLVISVILLLMGFTV